MACWVKRGFYFPHPNISITPLMPYFQWIPVEEESEKDDPSNNALGK